METIQVRVCDGGTNVFQGLLELEDGLDLCNRAVGGVYIWDHLRFPLYRQLDEMLGNVGQAHTKARMVQTVLKQVRALPHTVWRNPFTVSRKDILFYGHPRRKLESDGLWWDIYCDPIIEELEALNQSYLYVEDPYLGTHYRPSKTRNIRYLDSVNILHRLAGMLPSGKYDNLTEGERLARELTSGIERLFGVTVDIEHQLRSILSRRRATLPMYRVILRQVAPKVVVLVVGYGRETFIEACKLENIPVIELQHGVVDEVAYSFPGNRRKRYFPDYFFSFGGFWLDNVNLPIKPDRCFSVGYPYLELQHRRYPPGHSGEIPRTKRQILFLSQGTIGRELSKFAVSVEEKLSSEYRVVFKLHPGEYGRWRAEYPWLASSPIEVVHDDEQPLYGLFAESDIQVGVHSTALYEGLTYNLSTFLVELPGIDVSRRLADRGYAKIVTSVEHFINEISPDPVNRTPDTAKLFAANALTAVVEAIQEVIERES